MEKVKHALIGFGGMGGWHINNITKNLGEYIEELGVYDIRKEARDSAKEKGLYAFDSLEKLLESDAELVTIATPNNFHKELSIACMKAGKNVICEKPVMMNAQELTEVIKVRDETGKVFAAHQNRRWDKDFRIFKEIVNQNLIGKPYYVESRVLGSRRSLEGWRAYKIDGGGMVLDWGVHLLDQLVWFFSDARVTDIDAHLFNIFTKEVDDNFKTFIRFSNGVSALIEIATNCLVNLPRWHVTGERGTAVIEDWACNGKIVRISSDAKMTWDNDIVYTAAGPTRTMAPRPASTTEILPLPTPQDADNDYYKNIINVIRNGAELIVKPEQSLRVMKVVDTIFESARLGCSVKCDI